MFWRRWAERRAERRTDSECRLAFERGDIEALRGMGNAAVGALARILQEGPGLTSRDPWLAAQARRKFYSKVFAALTEIGTAEACDCLIRILTDTPPIIVQDGSLWDREILRAAAAIALVRVGNPQCPDALILALQHRVETAALALAEFKGPKAIDPILRYLFTHIRSVADKVSFWDLCAKLLDAGIPSPSDFIERYMYGTGSTNLFHGLLRASKRSALTKRLLMCVYDCCYIPTSLVTVGGADHFREALEADETASDAAVAYLCGDPSPAATNLLRLLLTKSKQQLAEAYGSLFQGWWPGSPWDIHFERERQAVSEELARRGNPSYRPEIFLYLFTSLRDF